MNIGIISARYTAGTKHDGGRAVYNIAHGLAELGHKVTVYTYNSSWATKKYRDQKVTVVSIGGIATNHKVYGLMFEDIETWNSYIWDELEHEDTIELILTLSWYGYNAANAHRELYGSKIIVMVGILANGKGGIAPFTDATKLIQYKAKELDVLRHVNHIIAFNRCSATEVTKLTLVGCSLIPLGVELSESDEVKDLDRILVIGRISREKCLELLLRAITNLNWCSVTICGPGSLSDYGKYVHKLISKLDLHCHVEITDGIPQDYYTKAGIVVCPSVYDPFGYSCLDAMAYGVPVIGNYSSYSDMIEEKTNGLLYQSIQELEFGLQELHTNTDMRHRFIGESFVKLVNYTQEACMESLLQVIGA